MKIDSMLTPGGNAGKQAAAYEEAGYDGAWMAEITHDPFLPLVSAAEHTDAIELGTGIAVAFVATLYGVGLANLVLLPIASRLRARAERRRNCEIMVVEAALAIEAGQGPSAVEQRLAAFLPGTPTRA